MNIELTTRTRTGTYGVWAPALTPFTTGLDPDPKMFVAHVHWLLANGCHGVALFGTTSEANSLSLAERQMLLECVIGSGVAPERLMVGTGCCALPDSVQLTAHAARLGCLNVLMLPPFYYKGVSDAGLADSFAAVIERVAEPNLKIFLYHFPRLTGVPITLGLVERLVQRYPDFIGGLKDSSGDPDNTRLFIERFPEIAVFPGSEVFLLGMARLGGAGCITASANVNPAAIRGVWDAWSDGANDADDRQAAITETRNAIEATAMVPTLKAILAAGQDQSRWLPVRPPLTPLDPAIAAERVAAVKTTGLVLAADH